jgi:hypothetical protein
MAAHQRAFVRDLNKHRAEWIALKLMLQNEQDAALLSADGTVPERQARARLATAELSKQTADAETAFRASQASLEAAERILNGLQTQLTSMRYEGNL